MFCNTLLGIGDLRPKAHTCPSIHGHRFPATPGYPRQPHSFFRISDKEKLAVNNVLQRCLYQQVQLYFQSELISTGWGDIGWGDGLNTTRPQKNKRNTTSHQESRFKISNITHYSV